MSTSSLGLMNEPSKKPSKLCLPPAFMLVSCLAYSSTLKLDVTCSSEFQLTFNRLHGVISQKLELFITTAVITSDATRCYAPEDSTLHNHRHENLHILHCVISQKIELFIITAVRTSHPTLCYIPADSTLHTHCCENLRSYK
jgi:hypothetical protein